MTGPVVTSIGRPPMPVRAWIYRHLPTRLRDRVALGLTRWVQRRPPEAGLRRKLLAQGAIVTFGATSARDYGVALAFYHPDYVGEVHHEELLALGFEARQEGHAGLVRFLEQWDEVWEDREDRPEAIHDQGDFALIEYTLLGRGIGSGAPMRMRNASCFLLAPDDGRVIRQAFFSEVEEALAWGRAQVAAGATT